MLGSVKKLARLLAHIFLMNWRQAKSRVLLASGSTYDNQRSTHVVTEGAVCQGMNVRCKEVNGGAFLVA
jgi:hypothetical protein